MIGCRREASERHFGVTEDGHGRAVANPQLQLTVSSLAEAGDHWREGPPREVVASLRDTGIVDNRPAKPGPDVIELPDQRAAAVRLSAAVMLDAELEPLGLADHGEVDVLLDAARQSGDDLQHRIMLVLRIVFVVMIETGTVDLKLIFRQPPPEGGQLRRGVNAELADELAPVSGIPPVEPGLPHRCELGATGAEVDAVPHLPRMPVSIEYAVDGRDRILAVDRLAWFRSRRTW
jgi:hypothetical protein